MRSSSRSRGGGRPGLAALLLCAALTACSESSEPPAAGPFPTAQRYASLYTPKSRWDKWVLESRLPKEPQKEPWMLIYEVTRYPNAEPTEEQREAAKQLALDSLASARRHGWIDFLKGMGDGFELAVGDDTHYLKREYLLDDAILDPDRPEFLMYYDTESGRKKLTGFMYYVRSMSEEGPQIGGPLTVWHYHVWSHPQCLRQGLIAAGLADARGHCKVGTPTHRSPEMIHVWFVEHPQGPFGTPMSLPKEVVEEFSWD